MVEETVAHFLQRRERELLAQISALRGQLAPKESELTKIQQMRKLLAGEPIQSSLAALAKTNSNSVVDQVPVSGLEAAIDALRNTTAPDNNAMFGLAALGQIAPASKYETMTIKQLVVQALIDHFPKGGTMMEIRDFIRLGYGRTIEPSSMRPQMHRLKADGILGQDASTDTWNFQDGKRQLYAMYDHPTSRAAMKELRDEEEDTLATMAQRLETALSADGKKKRP